MTETPHPPIPEKNKDLNGIAGWLYLVALGLIFGPLRMMAVFFPIYQDILKPGAWDALTDKTSSDYVAGLAKLMVAETTINSLLLITSLYLLYLFFTRKKSFTIWFIAISIFSVIFVPLDAIAVASVIPDTPAFGIQTTKEIVRSVIYALIWVPYMLISKRVKATFIR